MDKHETAHGVTISGYLMGFILAVILTLLSFVPVLTDLLHQWTVGSKIMYLLGLAIIQMLVQVFYFLHLNEGPDAKWNLGTFAFGVTCITIIIGGTWWAIQHLNYNMMGGSGRIVTPPVINHIVTNKQSQITIETKSMAVKAAQSIQPNIIVTVPAEHKATDDGATKLSPGQVPAKASSTVITTTNPLETRKQQNNTADSHKVEIEKSTVTVTTGSGPEVTKTVSGQATAPETVR